jgi:hypothetical protein
MGNIGEASEPCAIVDMSSKKTSTMTISCNPGGEILDIVDFGFVKDTKSSCRDPKNSILPLCKGGTQTLIQTQPRTVGSFEYEFVKACRGKSTCKLNLEAFTKRLAPECKKVMDDTMKARNDPKVTAPAFLITAYCQVPKLYSSLGFTVSKGLLSIIVVGIDCVCMLIFLLFTMRLQVVQ